MKVKEVIRRLEAEGWCLVRTRGSYRQYKHPKRRSVVTVSGKLGAYVPDLPGSIAAGETRDDVVRLIQEAIELHMDGLKAGGQTIPQPSSTIEFIDAIVERDGDWYIASCPEIPGANGQGRSKEEARASLADAIALILEDRLNA